MRTGIDPTVDYAFKRVFSKENEALLIHFLNAILDPPLAHRIAGIELLSTINDRRTEDDKLTVVDLRVRDTEGRRIIVEMQLIVVQAFRERILYYGCRDYVSQLQEGNDYSALMPTIVICIVGRSLFPRDEPHHFRFRLMADGCSEPFSDRLEIHSIELGKFVSAGDQLATALDQWLYFLKNGDELDVQDLPQGLVAPEVRHAVEVLEMISQTERDREQYELEFKRRHDLINREKLLFGQGLEEGREEGLEKGQLIERIRILTLILGEPSPSMDELKSLPIEVLSQRAAECQQRAGDRGISV